MIVDEDTHEELLHYGTPRRSGRYPWGTSGWGEGGETEQLARSMTFSGFVNHMKRQGLTDSVIAKGLGMDSSTQLRTKITLEKQERDAANRGMAQRLADKGNSPSAIAKRMKVPDSTVRSWLRPGSEDTSTVLSRTADALKSDVDSKGLLDIGSGVEAQLGISGEKLRSAAAVLEQKFGYKVHTVPIPQLTNPHDTKTKVLAPPGTTWGHVMQNRDKIQLPSVFSADGGRNFARIQPPIALDPKRVAVVYAEQGGSKKDGLIEVRPGKSDLSLGANNYAQVRIQVGPEHYLKGMAVKNPDLPPGVDVRFNSSKSDTGNKLDALKSLKSDTELPFESIVKQVFDDPHDPHKVTSVMNIVAPSPTSPIGNEEAGGWEWKSELSSQFLSKQKPELAKRQLDKTYTNHQEQLDKINSLTNPTVRKFLLEKFGDATDSSANHLAAAAISSRQSWHVILPMNSLKPNEVYAPNFHNGERVVLVRYPHGGLFEIPELTVNNKNSEGQRTIGSKAANAVGIHHTVAQRLSGADFDGDTVLVIPNNDKKIQHSPALEELMNFDPKHSYPGYEGMKPIGNRKQQLMGEVSNLITDMTIKGAPHKDIARAIKHSMVVIDADKGLNYKQSYLDNGISDLKAKYQGRHPSGTLRGASTLISRATSQHRVPQRLPRSASAGGRIDKTTGKVMYEPTNKRGYKSGKLIEEMSTKLAETDDAHTLSSGTRIESIYADHANRMKALANSARLESVKTPGLKQSASAKRVYAKEVESLNSKLSLAITNRPLERQARVIAGAQVKAARQANPNLERGEVKKLTTQLLETTRARLGANKKEREVNITSDEWDAIQAGAISNSMLGNILKNTDLEKVREYATPKRTHLMSQSKTSRAKAMLSSGAYTRAEVARFFGVSLSTLDVATKSGAA